MVHHMDKNPLVEVFGSFAVNVFTTKIRVKSTELRGMLLVCTLIQDVILCEFWLQKLF